MRKVSKKHVTAINTLMLNTTAQYITAYNTADMHSLVVYDVQHNINALAVFNSTNNVQQLHDSIMQQDTLVREYYIATLRYIEENNLIHSYNFCCI